MMNGLYYSLSHPAISIARAGQYQSVYLSLDRAFTVDIAGPAAPTSRGPGHEPPPSYLSVSGWSWGFDLSCLAHMLLPKNLPSSLVTLPR